MVAKSSVSVMNCSDTAATAAPSLDVAAGSCQWKPAANGAATMATFSSPARNSSSVATLMAMSAGERLNTLMMPAPSLMRLVWMAISVSSWKLS